MDKINLKQHNILTKRREPFRFMLWLGIFGSAMIFLLLVVIYISRKSASDWVIFPLPPIFRLSTLVILLSSLTLHLANRAFKRELFFIYRLQMALTLTLGFAFVLMQLVGWAELIKVGVKLNNNPAGAFVFLLSGLHMLHIAGGLVFLAIIFAEAIRRISYVDSFVYSVNPPNQLRIRLVTTYWHFVDVLWVLLFVFLLFHHS
jgi:cytochrome c oxidase subunit III